MGSARVPRGKPVEGPAMTPRLRGIIKTVRDRGPRIAATRALYRLHDAIVLRRLGIHSAMRDTGVNLSLEHSGLDDPHLHGHNPTESYYVFRQLIQTYINPGED